MAKANLTAAPLAFVARVEHDTPLPEVLSLLTKLTDAQIIALLDSIGTPRLERYLLLTMHQFVRMREHEPATLQLVDAWFRAMPELLKDEALTPRQRAMLQWTDSAAEAYVVN